MKCLTGMAGSLRWLSVFALVAPGLAGQGAPPFSKEEVRVFKVFTGRVQKYVKLQKSVEAALPALKPTNDASRITEHQHALATEIARARHDARRGDIFTDEVVQEFRRIVRGEFQGPEAKLARKTILPTDPSQVVVHLRVNDVYPESLELTNTPPTLLSKLPPLPQELAYRIVGHDLTLKDTKAGLIVDLIRNVIP
jgi:hypothetical protein